MYALIIDKRVQQVFTDNPHFPPELNVVNLGANPNGVQENWSIDDGGNFRPPTSAAPNSDVKQTVQRLSTYIIELPYGDRRQSVNNYFAQLSALKAANTLKPDQQKDLDTLMAAAAWEQSVVDKRDEILRMDNATALATLRKKPEEVWPPFPAEAAALVAIC